MGAELPHLLLFWRRYQRGWWRYWLPAALLWGGLIYARINFDAALPWLRGGSLAEELIILCGNFVVYLLLAQSMLPLVQEPGALSLARLRRGESGSAALWLATPLPAWRVLLSCLLSGLISVVPLVLGLIAYIMVSVSLEGQLRSEYFWTNLIISNLRLPHFALACACLLLALRQSALTPYLPGLLALGASLVAEWNQFNALPVLPYFTGGPGLIPGLPAGAQILLGGLLLLLCLQFLLWWASAYSEESGRRGDGGEGSLARLLGLLVLLCLPLMLGALSFGALYFGSAYELQEVLAADQLAVLHAAMLHFQPDVYPIEINPFGSFSRLGNPEPGYSLYGSVIGLPEARAMLCQMLGVSLLFWGLAALACVEAARRPRAARSRPASFNRPEDYDLC
ncbi:hypothetical protein IT575_02970 [bacterium]|nr:hypothetical protein [bacterium]